MKPKDMQIGERYTVSVGMPELELEFTARFIGWEEEEYTAGEVMPLEYRRAVWDNGVTIGPMWGIAVEVPE